MKCIYLVIILTLMCIALYAGLWTDQTISLTKKLLCTGGLAIIEVLVTLMLLIMDDHDPDKRKNHN